MRGGFKTFLPINIKCLSTRHTFADDFLTHFYGASAVLDTAHPNACPPHYVQDSYGRFHVKKNTSKQQKKRNRQVPETPAEDSDISRVPSCVDNMSMYRLFSESHHHGATSPSNFCTNPCKARESSASFSSYTSIDMAGACNCDACVAKEHRASLLEESLPQVKVTYYPNRKPEESVEAIGGSAVLSEKQPRLKRNYSSNIMSDVIVEERPGSDQNSESSLASKPDVSSDTDLSDSQVHVPVKFHIGNKEGRTRGRGWRAARQKLKTGVIKRQIALETQSFDEFMALHGRTGTPL